jgi:hypothetical protein
MDKSLNKVLDALVELDVNPTYLLGASFLIVMWFLTIWVFRDAIKEKIKTIKIPTPIQIRFRFKYKIKDLKIHPVFSHLNDLYKHNTHIFYTDGEPDLSKTRAFQDFLEVKMNSTIKHTKLILDKANESMDPLELRELIIGCFDRCNCNVETEMLDIFESKNISPKYSKMLIEKFLEVRQVAMDNYGKTFDSIFNHRTFNSNYEYLNTILFIIQNEGIQMVDACIKSFEHINGAFKDLDY